MSSYRLEISGKDLRDATSLSMDGDDPRRAAAWRPGAGSGASANSSSREYIRYARRTLRCTVQSAYIRGARNENLLGELDRLVGCDDAGLGGRIIVEDGDSGMAMRVVDKDVKSRWGRSRPEMLLYKRMGR